MSYINEETLNKIQAWLKNQENTPQYQGTYRFSTAKSYYEQLSQIYKFLKQYKSAVDDLDERVEDIEEELPDFVRSILTSDTIQAISNEGVYTLNVRTGNIDIEDLENYDVVDDRISANEDSITDLSAHFDALEDDVEELQGKMTTAEGNITSLQTNKENKLTAGQNITIDRTNPNAPVISATGSVSIEWSNVSNQPKINNHDLASGNNTLSTLGIQGTLTAGSKISISNDTISTTASTVSVNSTGTATDEVKYITIDGVEKKLAGGIAGIAWGDITGTLSNQSDLNTALSGKENADATILKQADVIDSASSSSTIYPSSANQMKIARNIIDAHVQDTNNPHSVSALQIGLGNVDNTSDLNKPVSTATQTALDQKQNTITSTTALISKTIDAGIIYTTTEPTSINSDGLKFAVLSNEPSTKYDGWLYIII